MLNQQYKVLIADDEEHILDLLALLLQSMGFSEILKACNGAEAVNLFKEHSPDLVILDMNMPFKNGAEVLKEIKEYNNKTCNIVLTTTCDADDVKNMVQLGINHYILKTTPYQEMGLKIESTWNDFIKSQKTEPLKNINLKKLLNEVEQEDFME